MATPGPESRARIEKLLAKGWKLPGEHPLGCLHRRALGAAHIVVLLGPSNGVGSRYFHLFLAHSAGHVADPPLALGLYSAGPFPAYNWVELVRYEPVLTLDGRTVDLASGRLDASLFAALSGLVPTGGHLMVEYDSPGQAATARALALGYPPAASHLGFLLFRAGCRSFRDWYISEGGREGPRKLQGFKPIDAAMAREKEASLRREIDAFLREVSPAAGAGLEAECRQRARQVLDALDGGWDPRPTR